MLTHYLFAPIAMAVLSVAWLLIERRTNNSSDCDLPEEPSSSACAACSQESCPSRVEP